MQQNKSVAIGKRNFTVRELTIEQIRRIDQLSSKNEVITALLSECTDTKVEELLPMAPSELEPLVDAMVEVNAPFFRMATKAQEAEVAQLLEQKIRLVSMISCFC